MANLMRKLFKNNSTRRFILSLTIQQQNRQMNLSPSFIPKETHHFTLTKPESLNNPNIFLNPKTPDNGKSTEPLKLYPSLAFGYLLSVMNSTGFDPLEAVEVDYGTAEAEDDDAGKVWADSVKKKRKKKMNKHKYKKLRKRLRRKT